MQNPYEGVIDATPLPPDTRDLRRLYDIIRSRHVITILEFGVGHSTRVMAEALQENKRDFGDKIGHLRRENPFKIFSVDSSADFIELTRANLKGFDVEFHHTQCRMGDFNGKICHFYDTLPNVTPDFIYLDAPGQFDVTGDIAGIHTREKDRLPMAADLLRIEYFLLPRTLILVDGRTANARFLRDNFQRAWEYAHDVEGDVHTFELMEPPLGSYNKAQIDFCLRENMKRVDW